MTQRSTIDRAHLLPAQIIWGGLVFSLFVLVFVAQTARQPLGDNSNPPAPSDLSTVFAFIAIALMGVSYAIRNLRLTLKQPTQAQLSPSQSKVAQYLPRMLIRCALHEAVAILGFVLATLSNSPEEMYPYVVAAIVANLFIFPSAERVGA